MERNYRWEGATRPRGLIAACASPSQVGDATATNVVATRDAARPAAPAILYLRANLLRHLGPPGLFCWSPVFYTCLFLFFVQTTSCTVLGYMILCFFRSSTLQTIKSYM